MSEKTHSEIVAEMNYGPIPEHRHDREILRYYAAELDAAHKRERGNCAKLREALEKIRALTEPCEGVTECEVMCNTIAKAALAAPARNCDNVKDHSDAIEKFEKWMGFSPKAADEQDEFFKEHWFEFAMWLIDMNEGEA